ncbi:hypothetical protein [Microbacterium sp. GXF7504]
MSDVVIGSGGAIAVDPEDLRRLADDLAVAAAPLADAETGLTRAAALLHDAPAADGCASVARAAASLRAAAAGADRLVGAVRTSAAAYELVELRIARDAADARGGRTVVDHLDARIAALLREHPDAAGLASDALTEARRTGEPAIHQLLLLGGMLPLLANAAWLAAAIATLRATGIGRIPRGARIGPTVPAPPLATVPPSTTVPAGPPADLAAAVARIPTGGDSRVRVERYDLPDGTRAFAVYVAGTQAFIDRFEWMDMPANAQLFTGHDAESLAAVRAALAAAGAEPGDELYAFGHSQGGMIVDALAADGTYRTEVLGTVGAPTSYDAGSDTFSVEVRHDDDPIAALAAGGHAQRVGAQGSFVAARTVDPMVGVRDLALEAHHLERYVETAALVDASGDDRPVRLRERLAVLATAGTVTVTEYAPELTPVSPDRGRDAG